MHGKCGSTHAGHGDEQAASCMRRYSSAAKQPVKQPLTYLERDEKPAPGLTRAASSLGAPQAGCSALTQGGGMECSHIFQPPRADGMVSPTLSTRARCAMSPGRCSVGCRLVSMRSPSRRCRYTILPAPVPPPRPLPFPGRPARPPLPGAIVASPAAPPCLLSSIFASASLRCTGHNPCIGRSSGNNAQVRFRAALLLALCCSDAGRCQGRAGVYCLSPRTR